MATRNRIIFEMHLIGVPFAAIGRKFNITPTRVKQIWNIEEATRRMVAKRRSWQYLDRFGYPTLRNLRAITAQLYAILEPRFFDEDQPQGQ